MVRPAAFADIPGIVSLLQDRFRKSHYASLEGAAIDATYTKQMLVSAIQRHGGQSPSAAWVQVATANNVIHGLLWAIIDRCYSIGNRLSVTDLFWVADELVPPRDPEQLYRNMIEWAWTVPAVIEVKAGTTRIIAEDDRAGSILKRLGMADYGRIYRMERPR